MIRTIQYSPYHTLQGEFVNQALSGRITIRIDGKLYTGQPVGRGERV